MYISCYAFYFLEIFASPECKPEGEGTGGDIS